MADNAPPTAPAAPARYTRREAWMLAMRPKTLGAGAAPVIVGIAMAWDAGAVDPASALCCLLTALFLQIGSNLANDYFDCFSKVDTAERLGPLRVTQSGLLPPAQVRTAFLVCLALGSAAGLYCVFRTGLGLLLLGALCVLFAVLYSAGPFPLSHLGLGELFALVFFGPVACGGTYYVLAGDVPPLVALAGAMPGLYAGAMLGINNLRDIASDAKAGKRTLAVRFGERFARWETAGLVLAASAVPLALAIVTRRAAVLAVLGLALPAWRLAGRLRQTPISRAFNAYLAAAAMLNLLSAIAFALVWGIRR